MRPVKLLAALALCAALALTSFPAKAGYDHGILNPEATPAYILGTDTASIRCRVLIDDLDRQRPSFIDCANFASAGVAQTFAADLTLDDNSGASPSLIFQDGTDLTATFAKADASFLGLTTSATTGLNVLVGNLKVGNGTPDVTQDGEDAYVEGTFEVDGASRFDGAVAVNATITATASAPTALVGPPPTAGGSSITLTAAKAGQVTKLDTAAGTTVTLPAATGTGNHYLMVVSVAATSNAHKILAASSSDNITGIMIGQNANTNKSFQCATASGFHSIQMPFAGTQPSGGLQGDSFEFIDVGTNLWFVRGNYSAGTTPTTPCSTSTS